MFHPFAHCSTINCDPFTKIPNSVTYVIINVLVYVIPTVIKAENTVPENPNTIP